MFVLFLIYVILLYYVFNYPKVFVIIKYYYYYYYYYYYIFLIRHADGSTYESPPSQMQTSKSATDLLSANKFISQTLDYFYGFF